MNKVLFEYETTRIFSLEGDRTQHDLQFIALENYLESISRQKRLDPLFNTPEEESSQKQRILDFDYKDYSISANQFVGVIQTKWLRLTLLPKIFRKVASAHEEDQIDYASRDLMYLLSYAYDLKTHEHTKSSFAKNQKLDFFEIFIFLFATQTLEVFERNFYHSYERIEENLGFVKGKIIFPDHFRQNVLKQRSDRIYCQYSLFQENNIFNQIIKYVATILFRKSKVFVNRNLLRKILHLLNDVDYRTCVYSDTEGVILNPTQKEFEPILNYCKLFLQNSLIKFNQNNIDIFCFLLDMNALYEKFVTRFLQKYFLDYKIEPQKSDRYVAEDALGKPVFQMRHDIFLTKNGESIILDTKYKATDFRDKKGGISQNDVYQMATYAIRRKCKNIILLYPKYNGDDSPKRMEYFITNEFSGDKVKLTAVKLDLTDLKGGKSEKDEEVKRQLRILLP